MSASNQATIAQVEAADPVRSTWLSANAGSGKTRVLTNRVARLLLREVPPERILCLTYTKAAASEMQNRLFESLGEWAMMADAKLASTLIDLGLEPEENTAQLRRRARTLFARAIETPGGLKIQTIHSFCASLLRRFPLEAGVSPQFVEMDDRAAELAREDVLEHMADSDAYVHLVDGIAAYIGGDGPANLLRDVVGHGAAFQAEESDISDAIGIAADMDLGATSAALFTAFDPALLLGAAQTIVGLSSTMDTLAVNLRACAALDPGTALFDQLGKAFFYSNRPEVKPSYLTKPAREKLGPVADQLDALGGALETAADLRTRVRLRDKSLALHRFGRAFLTIYEARKQRRAQLDFDDLIQLSRRLLTDPQVAQWVLFRLDGGIDHILVDEAQDTSPAQWDVIRLLAAEFTSGQGARGDVERTIFVVGDKKQSIYSFQGADPAGFDRMQSHFKTRLHDIEKPFAEMELSYSFRSANPILQLVDTVFERTQGHGLGGVPTHHAFFDQMPGRVDLWPVIEKGAKVEDTPWYDPVDLLTPGDHQVILARQIAAWIKARIGTPLPDAKKPPRPITPGDFLVLVQRRSQLFHEIIRACKAADLPIAGADRLKIGGELAVRDIKALLKFLATSEDDLSLAEALRSPLLGLSEADLHRLAYGRKGYLWQQVRAPGAICESLLEMLTDLRDQADYLRPYDLIERILTRHRGRQKLIGRLGPEAEDGIDALLDQALTYETSEVPSLTGFLGWASDEDQIKRAADTTGDKIRVMSVHGSKGLEAPILILPDTGKRGQSGQKGAILRADNGAPIWKSEAKETPKTVRALLDRRADLDEQERMRLLYVAMTRAEKWLVVAAGGDIGKAPGDSWYNLIESGLSHLGTTEMAEDGMTFTRFEQSPWPDTAAPPSRDARPETCQDVPDWARRHAATTESGARFCSPSDLGGAKALAGEGDETEVAMARGTAVHMLLEHLPNLPPAQREAAAMRLLDADGSLPGALDPAALAKEALDVLGAPSLAELFQPGTLAEVPLAAPLPELGAQQGYGIIDRLLVEKDRVLIVDYKTNRVVPDDPNHTPEAILRQMGAYASMARAVFAGREVQVAVLWTQTATLMVLPPQLIDAALLRAATS